MRITLVIMAAGIGSRFGGGIKQLAPVGLNGEIIMDYSIHDAIEAGFNKIVFIIRKDITAMGRLLLRERIKYLYLRSQRQYLGQYPVVCRSWRKSILRNMFLFLFHYLERVSSLSCGPVEIL